MPTIRSLPRTNAALARRRVAADDEDAKSVAQALRAVLVFLALVGFLAWAGIAAGMTPSALSGSSTTAQGDARWS
jgi:hypothetical protein